MKQKSDLTKLEQRIMHESGTEAAFSGEFWDHKSEGKYHCKCCGQPLFQSETKLDSSIGPQGLRGWPAFDSAISESVTYSEDFSFGMHRTKVACSNCGIHLGHVFEDPETSTQRHFCINSCVLEFSETQN